MRQISSQIVLIPNKLLNKQSMVDSINTNGKIIQENLKEHSKEDIQVWANQPIQKILKSGNISLPSGHFSNSLSGKWRGQCKVSFKKC